jgi:hypothetical protein
VCGGDPDDGSAPIATVQNEAEQIEAEQIEAEQIEAEQTETAENDEELEEDDDEDDGRGNPKGKGKERSATRVTATRTADSPRDSKARLEGPMVVEPRPGTSGTDVAKPHNRGNPSELERAAAVCGVQPVRGVGRGRLACFPGGQDDDYASTAFLPGVR